MSEHQVGEYVFAQGTALDQAPRLGEDLGQVRYIPVPAVRRPERRLSFQAG